MRDLLERLPLSGRKKSAFGMRSPVKRETVRLPPLESGESGFDLIVLVVFVFDIVIDAGDFL